MNGDNYLLARIQMLGLRVLMTASPYVIHQWHEPSQGYPNGRELAEKNRFLYNVGGMVSCQLRATSISNKTKLKAGGNASN